MNISLCFTQQNNYLITCFKKKFKNNNNKTNRYVN